MAHPKIELFSGGGKVDENDNWGGSAEIANAMAAAGAFSFANPNSRDAAAMLSSNSRDNSVRVTATGAGAVLAEIYDSTPTSEMRSTAPRLVNVSLLKQLEAGAVTVGVVIVGNQAQNVLIRAIGPTLTAFGVAGVLAFSPGACHFGCGAAAPGLACLR